MHTRLTNMSDNNYKKLGVAPRFHEILSTGLYTGLIPLAPGTAAAFVALLIWYGLYLVLSPLALFWTTIGLIIVVTVIGVWSSTIMEHYWGTDPRAVVIDEYVGTWIPLLVAPCGKYTWLLAFIGFTLFRIIDIFKPLGCKKIEQIMPGGWGIMFDDILAGGYALIIVISLKHLCFS